MLPSSDVTIYVPTYNRPEFLSRTLRFLQQGPVRLPIIVGDGSDASAAAKNETLCRSLGANIEYFHLPSVSGFAGATRSYLQRYLAALQRVKTPFVASCADDDLLLPETVVKCAAFLAENPDYVGCQGTYLFFRYLENVHLKIEGVCYDTPSVDGNEIGSRLMQFYWRYEAPFYAVYRTSVQRSIFERAQSISINILVETFHSAAVILEGKLKRLDDIYCLRNIGIPTHPIPIEGWYQWMIKDFDGFVDNYREHRATIIEMAASRSDLRIDLHSLRRAIDMAFMIYVGGHGFPMYKLIEEYLPIAVADRQERDRLQRGFATKFAMSFADQQEQGRLATEAAHEPIASQATSSTLQIRIAIKRLLRALIEAAFGESGLKLTRQLRSSMRPEQKQINGPAVTPPTSEPADLSMQIPTTLVNRFTAAQWDLVRRRIPKD